MTKADSGEYEFWTRSLAGEAVEMHDGRPQPGFYSAPLEKGYPSLPVAIWFDEHGAVQCKVGFDDLFVMRDAHDIWTWCCNKPVPYADYKFACRMRVWPEEDNTLAKMVDVVNDAILSKDGGEIETAAQSVEMARKAANDPLNKAKRWNDAMAKDLTEQCVKALKSIKQEEQS